MKSISRPLVWAFWAGMVFLLVMVLAWAGGILYWRIRVGRALRSWDKSFKVTHNYYSTSYGLSVEDWGVLMEAGCRALPQLVSAFEASENPDRQEALSDLIGRTLVEYGPPSEHSASAMKEWADRWVSSASDPPTERARKRAEMGKWWVQNGAKYYIWWRFWSKSPSGK